MDSAERREELNEKAEIAKWIFREVFEEEEVVWNDRMGEDSSLGANREKTESALIGKLSLKELHILKRAIKTKCSVVRIGRDTFSGQ